HMDTLTVHVEIKAEAASDSARKAAADRLGHDIKSLIGISSRIEIHAPGTIDRSEGKAKRIIDKRNPG
ncbi:MAG: phenylacetate--CoA ligase, partial [Sphingomonadales bacterium]